MTLESKADMGIGTVPDARILSVLEDDEQLLWSGRPGGGITFHLVDIVRVPVSLLTIGIALYWEVSVFRQIVSAPKALSWWVILPFPAVGALMIVLISKFSFERFIIDIKRRRRTRYALTNRRIIVVTGFGNQVIARDLSSIQTISLVRRFRGRGTLIFGSPSKTTVNLPLLHMHDAPSFEMIEEVKLVYELVMKAKIKMSESEFLK